MITSSVSGFSGGTKKEQKNPRIPPSVYSADIKIGPFRLKPSFSIKNAGYDSNIFFSPQQPVADYTATPTAGLRSVLLFGNRAFLDFGGELGWLWFARTRSQNYLNRYADAHLEFYLSRFTFYIEEGYAKARERFGYEIDSRTLHTINSLNMGINYEPSDKVSLKFAYNQDLLRYDSQAIFRDYRLDEILNHMKNSFGLTYRQQILPKTAALSEFSYTKYGFDNPDSNLNSVSYRALWGAEFDPSAFIQGTFKMGFAYLTFTSPDIKDYKGLAGSASLRFRFSDYTYFLVDFNQDTYFSYWAYYFLSKLYGGTLGFYLSERIKIDITGTVINNFYEATEIWKEERRIDRLHLYRVNIWYRLAESIGTGVGISYLERTSNWGYEWDGLTIFSLVSYEF
ncbi:MAG: outer membrane beta-barrel protein [Candidatus Aminicenantes bacterium]|nr:outer membrane beta-barrel protein [Candidatus Aminicenantes bacterium]MDH5714692.1 outer membrane beta-barrel protein [Candidatus Aminicenantes bacterium]